MKMNKEEIKKYTEAITKNSDNLFVCPRPVGPWQAPKGGLGHNSPQPCTALHYSHCKWLGLFVPIFQAGMHAVCTLLITSLHQLLYPPVIPIPHYGIRT